MATQVEALESISVTKPEKEDKGLLTEVTSIDFFPNEVKKLELKPNQSLGASTYEEQTVNGPFAIKKEVDQENAFTEESSMGTIQGETFLKSPPIPEVTTNDSSSTPKDYEATKIKDQAEEFEIETLQEEILKDQLVEERPITEEKLEEESQTEEHEHAMEDEILKTDVLISTTCRIEKERIENDDDDDAKENTGSTYVTVVTGVNSPEEAGLEQGEKLSESSSIEVKEVSLNDKENEGPNVDVPEEITAKQIAKKEENFEGQLLESTGEETISYSHEKDATEQKGEEIESFDAIEDMTDVEMVENKIDSEALASITDNITAKSPQEGQTTKESPKQEVPSIEGATEIVQIIEQDNTASFGPSAIEESNEANPKTEHKESDIEANKANNEIEEQKTEESSDNTNLPSTATGEEIVTEYLKEDETGDVKPKEEVKNLEMDSIQNIDTKSHVEGTISHTEEDLEQAKDCITQGSILEEIQQKETNEDLVVSSPTPQAPQKETEDDNLDETETAITELIEERSIKEVEQESNSSNLLLEEKSREIDVNIISELADAPKIVEDPNIQISETTKSEADEDGEVTVYEVEDKTYTTIPKDEDERELTTGETSIEQTLEESSAPLLTESQLETSSLSETTDGNTEIIENSESNMKSLVTVETTEVKLEKEENEPMDPLEDTLMELKDIQTDNVNAEEEPRMSIEEAAKTEVQVIEEDNTTNFGPSAGEKSNEASLKGEQKESHIEANRGNKEIEEQKTEESANETDLPSTATGEETVTVYLKEDETDEVKPKEEVNDLEMDSIQNNDTKSHVEGTVSHTEKDLELDKGLLEEIYQKETIEDLVVSSSTPQVSQKEAEDTILDKEETAITELIEERSIKEVEPESNSSDLLLEEKSREIDVNIVSELAETPKIVEDPNIQISETTKSEADEDGEETEYELEDKTCTTRPKDEDERELTSVETTIDQTFEESSAPSIIDSQLGTTGLSETIDGNTEIIENSNSNMQSLVTAETIEEKLEKKENEPLDPIEDTLVELKDKQMDDINAEEDPELVEPLELRSSTVLVAEEKSNETYLEINQTETDADKQNVTNQNLEATEEKVFLASNTTSEDKIYEENSQKDENQNKEVESKSEAETQINREEHIIEAVNNVVLREGVLGEVEKTEESEYINEQIAEKEICTTELQVTSLSDQEPNKIMSSNLVASENHEATSIIENTGIEELREIEEIISEPEASSTAKALEETAIMELIEETNIKELEKESNSSDLLLEEKSNVIEVGLDDVNIISELAEAPKTVEDSNIQISETAKSEVDKAGEETVCEVDKAGEETVCEVEDKTYTTIPKGEDERELTSGNMSIEQTLEEPSTPSATESQLSEPIDGNTKIIENSDSNVQFLVTVETTEEKLEKKENEPMIPIEDTLVELKDIQTDNVTAEENHESVEPLEIGSSIVPVAEEKSNETYLEFNQTQTHEEKQYANKHNLEAADKEVLLTSDTTSEEHLGEISQKDQNEGKEVESKLEAEPQINGAEHSIEAITDVILTEEVLGEAEKTEESESINEQSAEKEICTTELQVTSSSDQESNKMTSSDLVASENHEATSIIESTGIEELPEIEDINVEPEASSIENALEEEKMEGDEKPVIITRSAASEPTEENIEKVGNYGDGAETAPDIVMTPQTNFEGLQIDNIPDNLESEDLLLRSELTTSEHADINTETMVVAEPDISKIEVEEVKISDTEPINEITETAKLQDIKRDPKEAYPIAETQEVDTMELQESSVTSELTTTEHAEINKESMVEEKSGTDEVEELEISDINPIIRNTETAELQAVDETSSITKAHEKKMEGFEKPISITSSASELSEQNTRQEAVDSIGLQEVDNMEIQDASVISQLLSAEREDVNKETMVVREPATDETEIEELEISNADTESNGQNGHQIHESERVSTVENSDTNACKEETYEVLESKSDAKDQVAEGDKVPYPSHPTDDLTEQFQMPSYETLLREQESQTTTTAENINDESPRKETLVNDKLERTATSEVEISTLDLELVDMNDIPGESSTREIEDINPICSVEPSIEETLDSEKSTEESKDFLVTHFEANSILLQEAPNVNLQDIEKVAESASDLQSPEELKSEEREMKEEQPQVAVTESMEEENLEKKLIKEYETIDDEISIEKTAAGTEDDKESSVVSLEVVPIQESSQEGEVVGENKDSTDESKLAGNTYQDPNAERTDSSSSPQETGKEKDVEDALTRLDLQKTKWNDSNVEAKSPNQETEGVTVENGKAKEIEDIKEEIVEEDGCIRELQTTSVSEETTIETTYSDPETVKILESKVWSIETKGEELKATEDLNLETEAYSITETSEKEIGEENIKEAENIAIQPVALISETNLEEVQKVETLINQIKKAEEVNEKIEDTNSSEKLSEDVPRTSAQEKDEENIAGAGEAIVNSNQDSDVEVTVDENISQEAVEAKNDTELPREVETQETANQTDCVENGVETIVLSEEVTYVDPVRIENIEATDLTEENEKENLRAEDVDSKSEALANEMNKCTENVVNITSPVVEAPEEGIRELRLEAHIITETPSVALVKETSPEEDVKEQHAFIVTEEVTAEKTNANNEAEVEEIISSGRALASVGQDPTDICETDEVQENISLPDAITEEKEVVKDFVSPASVPIGENHETIPQEELITPYEYAAKDQIDEPETNGKTDDCKDQNLESTVEKIIGQDFQEVQREMNKEVGHKLEEENEEAENENETKRDVFLIDDKSQEGLQAVDEIQEVEEIVSIKEEITEGGGCTEELKTTSESDVNSNEIMNPDQTPIENIEEIRSSVNIEDEADFEKYKKREIEDGQINGEIPTGVSIGVDKLEKRDIETELKHQADEPVIEGGKIPDLTHLDTNLTEISHESSSSDMIQREQDWETTTTVNKVGNETEKKGGTLLTELEEDSLESRTIESESALQSKENSTELQVSQNIEEVLEYMPEDNQSQIANEKTRIITKEDSSNKTTLDKEVAEDSLLPSAEEEKNKGSCLKDEVETRDYRGEDTNQKIEATNICIPTEESSHELEKAAEIKNIVSLGDRNVYEILPEVIKEENCLKEEATELNLQKRSDETSCRDRDTDDKTVIEERNVSELELIKHEEKEEEGDEDEKVDSGSDAPVMVEVARDVDVKVSKKSHGILSGVGSKVKHSISKVKKVITGKSSHSKSTSPK